MNRTRHITCRGGSVSSLLILGLSVTVAWGVQYKVATVPEKTLRQFAKTVVMPIYPDIAQRNGVHGVAIAQLNIDEEGSVTNVEILEAPHESIGSAVVAAVKKWKFERPIDDSTGKAVRLSGKLTFYFVIENGRGVVKNPK